MVLEVLPEGDPRPSTGSLHPAGIAITVQNTEWGDRGIRGLTQDQLAGRAGLTKSMVGKYETGRSKLTTEDQRKSLEGLDYPERVWAETLAHVSRVNQLRRRYAATRTVVVDSHSDADPPFWVLEPDGSVDLSAARAELRRLAEEAARGFEVAVGDLMALLVAIQTRPPSA